MVSDRTHRSECPRTPPKYSSTVGLHTLKDVVHGAATGRLQLLRKKGMKMSNSPRSIKGVVISSNVAMAAGPRDIENRSRSMRHIASIVLLSIALLAIAACSASSGNDASSGNEAAGSPLKRKATTGGEDEQFEGFPVPNIGGERLDLHPLEFENFVSVEVGETVTVCASGFIAYDINVIMFESKGGELDPARISAASEASESAVIPVTEDGHGCASIVIHEGTPLGTYDVDGAVDIEGLQDISFRLTAAAAAGEPLPAVCRGHCTDEDPAYFATGQIVVTEAVSPSLTVNPELGPPGAVFEFDFVRFEPNDQFSVSLYAWIRPPRG